MYSKIEADFQIAASEGKLTNYKEDILGVFIR